MKLIYIAIFSLFFVHLHSQVSLRMQTAGIVAETQSAAIQGGKNGVLNLQLSYNPGVDTKLYFVSDDSVTFFTDTITFTSLNFSTPQTVQYRNDKSAISTDYALPEVRRSGIEYIDVEIRIKSEKYTEAKAGKIKIGLASNTYLSQLNPISSPDPERAWDTLAMYENVESNYFHHGLDDLRRLRQDVINFVFPNNNTLPVLSVDSIYEDVALNARYELYCNPTGFVNFAQMNVYIVEDNGFKHFFYHILPAVRRNEVIFLHAGHTDTIGVEAWDIDNNYIIAAKTFVRNGYDVVFSQMPCQGLNTGPGELSGPDAHSTLYTLNSGVYNPISAFLSPWIRVKNYLVSELSPGRLISTGLSGGGWTADFWPAIDTTIHLSFSVAGSSPLYVREIVDYSDYTGDYEQGGQIGTNMYDFYREICSYEDIYVLAAENRRHYQIININDDCCFWGRYYQTWAPSVAKRSRDAGGTYEVKEYIAPYEHQYTQEVSDYIIQKLKQ